MTGEVKHTHLVSVAPVKRFDIGNTQQLILEIDELPAGARTRLGLMAVPRRDNWA